MTQEVRQFQLEVTVVLSCTNTYSILAESYDEAVDIAESQVEDDFCSFNIDDIEIRQIEDEASVEETETGEEE